MSSDDDLTRAVIDLPARERQVVTLRKVYELTGPEIAVRLGISEEEVDVAYAAAVSKLWKVSE